MEPEARRSPTRGLATLLRELRDDTTTLLRQELQLAKTEVSEKVDGVKRNSIYVALGGIILYTGLLFVLLGLSVLLYFGLVRSGTLEPVNAVFASLGSIGLILAIVGGIFLGKGLATLKNESVKLDKTMHSLEENKEWAKHKVG